MGVAEEEGEDSGSEWAEEVLAQAQEAAEAAKENLHANRPGSKVCFLNKDKQGTTTLSILNPDSMEGEYWAEVEVMGSVLDSVGFMVLASYPGRPLWLFAAI